MTLNSTIGSNVMRASDLRRLSQDARDAILAAAAAQAENVYRTNPQLTDLEAFGEDDLHGKSTAANEG
jgi:hypothetical protein